MEEDIRDGMRTNGIVSLQYPVQLLGLFHRFKLSSSTNEFTEIQPPPRLMNTSIYKLHWQILAAMLATFSCAFNAKAQGNVYAFSVYKALGTAPLSVLGYAVDGLTNTYPLGGFSTTTTINGTTLNNPSGYPNILLMKFKYTFTNAPQWVIAPATDYSITGAKIGADKNGDSFVAGSFGGTNLTFGTTTITNNSTDHSDDIFWVKYDVNGNFKLLTRAGGTSEDALGDMATDLNGNCFLTGAFQSSTFSAGTSSLTRQSTSGSDCFVLEYNNVNGSVVWIQQGSYAGGSCIAVDTADNCYVGGTVLGSAVFNGLNPANQTTTNFLIKYNSAGSLLWVRGDVTVGTHMKVDKGQNIYLAGTFSNVAQFGGITLTNNSAATIFLAKCDANGNALWAQQLPGLGDDTVTGIAIDAFTNCWITGYLAPESSPKNTVAVIARYDQNGNLTALSDVNPAQASTAGGVVTVGNLAALPYGGQAFMCGSFITNFTLGTYSLTNGGNTDIFAAWVMASPSLSLTTTSTNVTCSWPGTTNFSLEAAVNLSSSNWSSVTNAVTTVNGQSAITITNSGGVHFYRLRLK